MRRFCLPVIGTKGARILLGVMEKHFASLKLLDSDSDQMLTRSYSHSDLLSPGKIYLQQSYRSENPAGLVRQYSCEQIFDEATKTR